MRIEIKQRIEQIRRGEVPDGYKKSPFGILPNDWKIKKLSDVLKKQTKINPPILLSGGASIYGLTDL